MNDLDRLSKRMSYALECGLGEKTTAMEAVFIQLNGLEAMGPTSRKEVKMIEGMLDNVQLLGLQAIRRRRLRK